ncbi:MAG: hypothetical protein U0939_22550 [Pirellulales bacterium]
MRREQVPRFVRIFRIVLVLGSQDREAGRQTEGDEDRSLQLVRLRAGQLDL